MATIANLNVKIGANIKELQTALQGAQRSIQDMSKRITSLGKSMSKKVSGPIAALGGGLVALQKKTADYADNVLDMADATGISTDSLQEFEHVARSVGVPTDTLTRAFSSMARRMSQVEKGSGPMAEAFEQLGVQARDANGEMRAGDDVIMDVFGALETMEPGLERAGIATQIFGRRWEQIAPLLGRGTEGIDQLRAEAHELGAVMGKDSLEAADEFRRGMEQLQAQLTGVGREFAVDLMPAVQSFIPLLQDAASAVGDAMRRFGALEESVQRNIFIIGGLVAAIGPALVIIGKLGGGLSMLIGVGAKLVPVIGALAKGVFALISPLGLKIALVGALVAGIGLLIINFKALGQRVWRVMTQMQNRSISAIQNMLLAFQSVADVLPGIDAPMGGIIERLGEMRAEVPDASDAEEFRGFGSVIGDTLDSLRERFSFTSNEIEEFNEGVGEATDKVDEHAQAAEAAGKRIEAAYKRMQEARRQAADESRADARAPEAPTDHIMDEGDDWIDGITEGFEKLEKMTIDFSAMLQDVALEIGNVFASSFGHAMSEMIVFDATIQDVFEHMRQTAKQVIADIIAELARMAAMRAFQIILGAGTGGGSFGVQALMGLGAGFRVNDALITSRGDVVKFHPDDNILAMKDFGALGSGGGSQHVTVSGEIRNDAIFISNERGGRSWQR